MSRARTTKSTSASTSRDTLGRSGFSLLVALLLVALLLSPSTSPAVAAPTPTPTPDLPLTQAGLEPTSEGLQEPDSVAASQRARVTNERVEVVDARSNFGRTWALPQGGFESETTGSPARFEDESAPGGWRDVDTTLVTNSDGTISPKAVPEPIVLAGFGEDAENLVTTATGSKTLVFGTGVGDTLPAPRLDGSTATYPDVIPDVDVVVEARSTGFEQLWVAKNRAGLNELLSEQANGDRGVSAELDAGNATITPQGDGSIHLTDASSDTVSQVPAPTVWDATLAPDGTPASEVEADISLVESGKVVPDRRPVTGDAELSVTVDEDWLNDPARQYPITIDPTYVTGADQSPIFDTYVKEGATTDRSDSTYLPVGYGFDDAKNRSFLNFDTSDFQGLTINTAALSLWADNAGTCTPSGWSAYDAALATTDARWTAQPATSTKYSTSTATKGFSSACAAGRVSINMTSQLQAWSSDAGSKVQGMALVADNETSANYYHRFWSSDASSNLPVLTWTWQDDGTSSASTDEVAQQPLIDVSEAVESYLDGNPSVRDSHYSGMEMSVGTLTTTIYWVGSVPADFNSLLNSLRSSSGTQITVTPAPYTDDQLQSAAETTMASNTTMSSMSVAPDGTGLNATYATQADADSARSNQPGPGQRAANVPPILTFDVGDAAEPSSRQDDSSPWYGAGHISGCTTGFAMSKAGKKYMLTAAHCAPGNGLTIRDGGNDVVGTTTNVDYSDDSVMITPNGSVAGRMFDGPWNSTTSEVVKGAVHPKKGMFICTSGSATGTHCNIKVTNTRYRYRLKKPYAHSDVVILGVTAMSQTAGGRANGLGDSGGAVLINTKTKRQIKAVGIISALYGTETTSCSGLTSRCSNGVAFVAIQNAVRSGGSIVTG